MKLQPSLSAVALTLATVVSAWAAPADSARGVIVPTRDSTAMDSLASALLRADSAAAALIGVPVAAPPETVAAVPIRSVPVFLGGREIFRVRVGRDGLDPAARAAAIRARLTQAVIDSRVSPESVRLIPLPDGVQVQLGPHFLWLITGGDAPSHDASELAAILVRLPQEIRDGIERERAGRRPARVLISASIALALTLVALMLFRLLLAGSSRWREWLNERVGRRLPAIRLRNFEVLPKAQFGAIIIGLLARLDVAIGILLLYGYLAGLFSLFPWTQGWSSTLVTFAFAQVLKVVRNIASGVPGLFAIAVIFWLFRWLNNIAGRFFDAIGDGSLVLGHFHPELAAPSRRLVGILLWLVAIMVSYPYIPGSGSRAVQGVSILFGLVFSLGSTGIIGNMVAGVVLTYSRSFKAGDRVRIGEHVGDVVTLGFFATKLITLRNEEVTIPNGQVAGTSILNYTRLAEDPGLILHTQVTIGYDVDWRTVHALLAEAALRVEGVEKEPPPRVLQRSLDDHYPTYELTCVTHDSHAQLRLYSDLHAEIQDAFSRAGVEILSPAYHAIRDANAPVLPREPAGPREAPGGFRIARGE
jgi:small-conductance mechanosensitive channel